MAELDTSADSFEATTKMGIKVAIGLAVLTLIEYFIAVGVTGPIWIWLSPFLVAKAWLIMDYYMHVRDVTGGGH